MLVALGGTCTDGGTDCDTIANAQCRNDGAGFQCLCLAGYDGTAGQTECTIKGQFCFCLS